MSKTHKNDQLLKTEKKAVSITWTNGQKWTINHLQMNKTNGQKMDKRF